MHWPGDLGTWVLLVGFLVVVGSMAALMLIALARIIRNNWQEWKELLLSRRYAVFLVAFGAYAYTRRHDWSFPALILVWLPIITVYWLFARSWWKSR